MMKKILVFSTCLLMLGLMAGPASAQIAYSNDILEDGNPGGGATSLKTWDETWTMKTGETIEMDIWLTDAPESILTSGCSISFDQTLIELTNVVPYDTANGGVWDAGFTGSFLFAPGQWIIQLGNLACVALDGDGDILLARVTFHCLAVGDADVTVETIPGFTTVVGCSGTEYDDQIDPNTVTVTQAECTVDGDCDDGDVCNGLETCDAGTCQPGTALDCDDGDLCTTDSCDPVTGCDNAPVECPPGETCDPSDGQCKECLVDGDCDDGDACTGVETCDAGTCLPGTPLDCDDGDLCTTDSCDPATGCDNVPVECPGGQICDPADGLCKACTTDEECDDGDACNGVETCDAGTCLPGTPVDCSDGDLCTQDICDPVDGSCSHPAEDCDDGIACTNDSCDPATGCINDPDDTLCDDGADCTDDTCDPDAGCQNEDNCPAGEFCDLDAEPPACEQIPTTTTTTSSPPSGCTTDNDCDDGVFCNGSEICTNGSCVDGTPPCPAELCDEDTDTCLECLVDDDCDDGVDCTDDSCVDGTCANMPNDEMCPDDGLYCNGEEFCDEADGCSSTGDPCAPGETCDEETDTCAASEGCSIDVVPASLPKSHWIPLFPGIIRINTVDVNPTFFSRINISCDSDGMGFFPRAVLPLGKVILPSFGGDTTVVIGYALILPASWTGSLGMESETCTVTVGDCQATDTFDLNYFEFIGIPLSE